nr:zinc finger, CCHC-type [Tanacetum cinerariifolium]
MVGNTVKEMTTNFGKLDTFEGHDFRRSQMKMHFLLTTLKVVYVLTTPMPELLEDATIEAIRIRAKWENDDYICRGHILNGMSDSLFDVYTNIESAKELCDSLKSKYMSDDSSSKKFLDFKHTLKQGKDDLSLVQLGSHLRIEESLRAHDSDKGKGKEVGGPYVNMTEDGGKNKPHKQTKGKKRSNENNSGSGSNKKPKLECWKCGKTGHFKRGCRSGKKNNANAGGSKKGYTDQSQYQDSGATTHVCKDCCWFKTFEPVEDGSVLNMGDEYFAPVHGKGSVALEFSSKKTITLFNVLYVPKLRKNLVSGPMLNKCGYKQVYESDKYVLSKSGVFVGFRYYNNGMFMLNLNKVLDDSDSVYMSSSTVVNSSLRHAYLGHVHYKRMLEMSKDDLIPAVDENPETCTTCMLTKITRKPFQSITRKSVILELIHSDLCDFHATPSLGNKKSVISFIDDASGFCYVYLLHAKDEAFDKFRICKTEVELQQNDLDKTLRTDKGGEYYDPLFFESVGIIHETTTHYTPQQNDVAERKNRALKEMVNSMLSYSGLSQGFWVEAMAPNKRNKTTPYELWYKKRPNLSFLRVWGCRAVVRLSDPKRKTLGEKGIDCIFVGYAEHSKAYRFYVIEPNDSVSINSIIESKDAIFDENRFSSIHRPKDIIPNSDESQRDDLSDDVPNEIPESRKSKRVRKAKSHGSDFQLYLVEGSRDQVGLQYSYCYSIEEDPRTYNEAMKSRDSAFWKEAIDNEIGSIMENNTWVLYDLPPGCKPSSCKWIFKTKMKVDGIVDKFKARLVIQGFRQKEGIDYFNTYAPVARINTIRLLLALAAIHNLVIHQMDVKDKEVYMKQPEEFIMPGNEHKVCKLVKSLLNVRIRGLSLHNLIRILKKFNREDCYSVSTPMDPIEKLEPNTRKLVDQLEYSRAIGCLMYAMKSTRPDIAYVVGRLSRFTSYSDAIWINHVEDSSSTSGWVFLLGGGAISWASKKQTCITGSTMESEFIVLASAGVRHSMVRELIRNGVISIEFVWTSHNLADHLTKGLARDLVYNSRLGVIRESAGKLDADEKSSNGLQEITTNAYKKARSTMKYANHEKPSSKRKRLGFCDM